MSDILKAEVLHRLRRIRGIKRSTRPMRVPPKIARGLVLVAAELESGKSHRRPREKCAPQVVFDDV